MTPVMLKFEMWSLHPLNRTEMVISFIDFILTANMRHRPTRMQARNRLEENQLDGRALECVGY